MTNQFNIKTTQKKVLQVTEETVVQLSNLDLGTILREKFNLPDAEILWDTQGGFPVCKIRSVKKVEEVQEPKEGDINRINPDDPSTWKVGDEWVCVTDRYGSFHPFGYTTVITKLLEDKVYSTDPSGDSSSTYLDFKSDHKFLCRPVK